MAGRLNACSVRRINALLRVHRCTLCQLHTHAHALIFTLHPFDESTPPHPPSPHPARPSIWQKMIPGMASRHRARAIDDPNVRRPRAAPRAPAAGSPHAGGVVPVQLAYGTRRESTRATPKSGELGKGCYLTYPPNASRTHHVSQTVSRVTLPDGLTRARKRGPSSLLHLRQGE